MQNLNEDLISMLRQKGYISAQEIAYKKGDLLIAENVISNEKRVLEQVPRQIVEATTKKILKG